MNVSSSKSRTTPIIQSWDDLHIFIPWSGPPKFECNSNLKNHPVHAKIEPIAHGNNQTAEFPTNWHESQNWSKTEYQNSYCLFQWTNQDLLLMLFLLQYDQLDFIETRLKKSSNYMTNSLPNSYKKLEANFKKTTTVSRSFKYSHVPIISTVPIKRTLLVFAL